MSTDVRAGLLLPDGARHHAAGVHAGGALLAHLARGAGENIFFVKKKSGKKNYDKKKCTKIFQTFLQKYFFLAKFFLLDIV